MEKLFIIGNEKISCNNNIYHSANIDFKSITESLSKYFRVNLLARSSSKKETFKINHKDIKISSNIFFYIFNILSTFNNIKNNKYLIISITPYTFIAFLLLFIFSNNIYLYLRSDGFKEYEKILGKKWVFLYNFMFFFFLKKTKIISCEKSLVKKKSFYLVEPSELEELWFINRKKIVYNNQIKLLYAGRIRIEKGIFNFINLFLKLNKKFIFTIIGDKYHESFNAKNIIYKKFFSNINRLIAEYDNNHIFVLPSYTESHPKVVYEALVRLRPVIVFGGIRHIIRKTKGIFVCKRNSKDFVKKVNYIMRNYRSIQKKILTNNFPEKKIFINQLLKILS